MKILYRFGKRSVAKTAFLLLVLFVTGWPGHKVQAQIHVKNGLQIYYPFNGSAKDFSGQANDGVPTNLDYAPDRSGFDSSAAFFNGISGFVTSTFAPAINVDFTVCGWAKMRSLPPADQLWPMVAIEQAPNDFFLSAGIDGSDTTLGFVFKSAGNYQTFTKSKVYRDSLSWFHFCITRAGQVQTQYVNGVAADTQQVAAGFVDGTTNPLTLGRIQLVALFGRGGYFNGYLDEVRLYDRALNRLEIDTLSGLVPLQVKKSWEGLLVGRAGDGKVVFSSPDPVAEVSFYDLKGAKLSSSRSVLPNRPYYFDAPQNVLIQILDKKGNRYARFVP